MSAGKIVLSILGVCISILIFVAVVFGLIKLGTMSYETGYRVFTEKPMEDEPGSDRIVEVPKGISPMELSTLLEQKGLVKDDYLFFLQMHFSAYGEKVKPGIYTLNTSQTAREILQIMSAEDLGESEESGDSKEGKDSKEYQGKSDSEKK